MPRLLLQCMHYKNKMNTFGENDIFYVFTKLIIFHLIQQVAPQIEQLCIKTSLATLLCNINDLYSEISEKKIFKVAFIVKSL